MRLFLFRVFLAVSIAAGLLIALRFWAGPFRLWTVHVSSPVNVAGVFAISFMALVLLDTKNQLGHATAGGTASWTDMALIAALAAAAFWPNLTAPFVYDDYTHIVQSSHADWRILYTAFARVPGGHGLFFRPVGFISYWIDYQWAGNQAMRWHAWNAGVHAINACLVYRLVKRLGMGRGAAVLAGLMFALHGTRAETVAWSDARFDLLAAFFTLCVVLGVLAYCRNARWVALAVAGTCAALAVCTKESAFCVPLLPIALLPLLRREERRRAAIASAVVAGVCAVIFAYRWWALGGIGGYADAAGVSTFWRSRPLHTSEAMLFRQWGFLLFPVNWTVSIEWWLIAASVGYVAVLIWYARRGRGTRTAVGAVAAGPLFLLAATLPVQHLLMFQPDLAGARVLYLPVCGFAILWAVLMDRAARPKLAYAAGMAAIVFQVAALEHNLRPWRWVPATAAAACRQLGSELAGDSREAYVSGVPDRIDGVYFLSNGFPECVEMNSGQPAGRVHLDEGFSAAPVGARRFVWKRETRGFVEVK